MKNKGIFEEEEMCILLNNKRFGELSKNTKNIINNIFGHVDENELVSCSRLDNYMKPDLVVTLKGETHYVSMKTGSNGIVHEESIFKFCNHLKEIGISDYTIDTLLLFHFGDGTLDGTGEKRYPFRRVVYFLDKRIRAANKELNSNRKFVLHIVNRCIFKGTDKDNILAEYVYHGDHEYGVIVSRKQVLMHCKNNEYAFMENLHIGPLLLHPHARYVGKEIKSRKHRETVEFHWANYFTAIRKISNRYNGGDE